MAWIKETSLESQLAEARRQLEVYKRAKEENDERFLTALAASQQRERELRDLAAQIASRCTSELQDRSGQHVSRVPGSRQWRDALYSIRLQAESALRALPEGKPASTEGE